jgi:hypothetical protein
MKTVAFLSNKLTLRGTEVALYDYAHFNETMLGNKSIIITKDYEKIYNEFDVSLEAYTKFKNRFQIKYYSSQQDIDTIVEENNITHLYIIKGGNYDDLISTKCTNIIHCVFSSNQPHGQIYSVVSDDVNRINGTNYPVVPHMIHNHDTTEHLRNELSIPENALVFGRYGGNETFDLSFVHQAIYDVLNARNDVWFIFMNTYEFCLHPRIIYLRGTSDMEYKKKFINTSDAMIHARIDGESFGITCGEFAIEKKPIITWSGSRNQNHINILGSQAVLYSNYDSAYKILYEFEKNKYNMDSNGYFAYSPRNVMDIFSKTYFGV